MELTPLQLEIMQLWADKSVSQNREYNLSSDSIRYFYDDDSKRNIRETKTMRIFTCIEKWEYQDDDAPMIIKTRLDNESNNCCKNRWDWTYTVYIDRDWQPLYFH